MVGVDDVTLAGDDRVVAYGDFAAGEDDGSDTYVAVAAYADVAPPEVDAGVERNAGVNPYVGSVDVYPTEDVRFTPPP